MIRQWANAAGRRAHARLVFGPQGLHPARRHQLQQSAHSAWADIQGKPEPCP